MTGFDVAEHIIDRRLGQQPGGVAKMLDGRLLGEGTQRAEKSDAQRLFQG
ncbi:hypothetical protein SDC9_205655 [bioreactor metagenome]|uniref:Uncharacterized protein n=1 Tax=bioreactor metagenome TaxID=1076179 RepID=A0A645J5H6_9ZZZZ